MSTETELDSAWREWRAYPRPFENFRRQHAEAPTYKIECDLDHQADYVAVLFEAWRDRNPDWDVPMRTRHELTDLHAFESQLRRIAPPPAESHDLQEFIRRTRTLLDAILGEAEDRAPQRAQSP